MRTLLPLIALAACTEGLAPVDTTTDGGNAFAAYEDAQGRRLEAFDWGADTRNEVVDYVFVLDNSISMHNVLDTMRKSFAALGPEDFPPESRIAVLNTVPPDPVDPSRPHPAVSRSALAMNTPGYGGFVTAGKIKAMRERHPALRARFQHDGCGVDGWFTPDQKNARGVPCLIAHTQISLQGYGAEAGLTALEQALELNTGKLTFRPGAAVNIIFVSDTHDPGVKPEIALDLLTERPTSASLTARIERDNPVSSVRFHAIAPATECVEPWQELGPSYYDAAKSSGGATIDMCTTEDYRPVLQHALDLGARPTRPVLALGAHAEEVVSVEIDGIATTWSLHPSGRAVTVDGAEKLPQQAVAAAEPARTIEVRYRKVQPERTMNPQD